MGTQFVPWRLPRAGPGTEAQSAQGALGLPERTVVFALYDILRTVELEVRGAVLLHAAHCGAAGALGGGREGCARSMRCGALACTCVLQREAGGFVQGPWGLPIKARRCPAPALQTATGKVIRNLLVERLGAPMDEYKRVINKHVSGRRRAEQHRTALFFYAARCCTACSQAVSLTNAGPLRRRGVLLRRHAAHASHSRHAAGRLAARPHSAPPMAPPPPQVDHVLGHLSELATIQPLGYEAGTQRVERPMDVVVVGAGPAGLAAASTLAVRACCHHQVPPRHRFTHHLAAAAAAAHRRSAACA